MCFFVMNTSDMPDLFRICLYFCVRVVDFERDGAKKLIIGKTAKRNSLICVRYRNVPM